MNKKFQTAALWVCLGVLALSGVFLALNLAKLPPTVSASIHASDVTKPSDETTETAQDVHGVADVVLREDLEKTSSLNAVTAVVFDFRGYDTLGESFVLLTAISGSMLILRGVRRRGKAPQSAEIMKKEDAADEKEES